MARNDVLNEVITRVKEFNRRIRDLEEKVRNLNARVNTVEDTMFNKTKKINTELSDINDTADDLADRVRNTETEIKNIQRHTRKLVTRRELRELEDYMDLMNPIQSSFVTKNEVESLIEKKLQEKNVQGDYK